MSGFDSIKWEPHCKVLQYNPETVREIAAYLDTHGLRSVHRANLEPSAEELRMLESLHGLTPDSIVEAHGNLLTTAGLNRITALIVANGSPQALTNSRTAVGVGNSSTAATVSDAALGGNSAGNSWWQQADSTYPSQANGVITTYATFASADGNFAWNEWGLGAATAAITANAVFNTATTTGVLINHKVQSLGTKVSGAVWTLQSTITLS
jgi:hypothetical protein